jgi:hypothetical protein
VFEQENPLMRATYLLMASVAGAITALSIRPFRGMTRTEVTLAIFIGSAAAIFLGPIVVRAILGPHPDMQLQAGIFYIIATGNNAFVPAAVKWTLRMSPFNKGDSE